MSLGKKFLTFPAQLLVVVCVLVLLLGANSAEAQIRTVVVSPVPGNSVASGTALRNALAGISSPSSTNRWLLKIEPGIYDVGTTALEMRSWVDIEGSGIGVTTIRGSNPIFDDVGGDATIQGASNTELRLLTVEAVNSAAAPGVMAMANYNGASPRLYRVRFSATGDSAWGLRNLDSTPLIEECEISVNGTGATGGTIYGIVFRTGALYPSPPPSRSSILRSKIMVSGGTTNIGIYLSGRQFVTEIRDSRVDVVGGGSTRGLQAESDVAWLGQESLQIRNSEIISGGGSSASYGIEIISGVWIALEVNESKVWGHVSPITYGIKNSGQGAVVIQGSSVTGFTQTVQAAGNASIASTFLQGGPATAQGWIGCIGVWDENAIFYAQGGCP